MKREDMHTGPMFTCGRMTLFVWAGWCRGKWYDRKQWGLDADGIFAIRTPWFMLYPW